MLITMDEPLNKYFGLGPRLCYHCNVIEKIKTFPRFVRAIIISVLFFSSGFLFLDWGFENAGVTALFASIIVVIYYITLSLLKKLKIVKIEAITTLYGEYSFLFLLGIIYISAIVESIPYNMDLTIFFALVGLFILLHTYLELSRFWTGRSLIEAYLHFGLWGIGSRVITFLFIIALNYEDEPFLDLIGTIFIVFWLASGVWWIVKQIKFILNLKKEKKETELLHLKSQVNPHFFFNMLNNLYALVDEDSEKAKKLILALSDLMRYSIYEGDRNVVPIRDEITYIHNFLELHQMRYYKEIDIQFIQELEDTSIEIMPLMFIILVENAFKHGVEKLPKEAYVHISLKGNKKQLTFDVKNNFDLDEVTDEKGIGLSNLRRRLELVYPKHHELTIDISYDIYAANLSLQL
ncbi:MAG: two-component system sensor histidine kinase AlgZ [Saprospiraceae bacterium]|jgi:two-component system sensor histidine kinase AlgZ